MLGDAAMKQLIATVDQAVLHDMALRLQPHTVTVLRQDPATACHFAVAHRVQRAVQQWYGATHACVWPAPDHHCSLDALAPSAATPPRADNNVSNDDRSVGDLVKQLECWLSSSCHLAIPLQLVHQRFSLV